MASPTLPRPKPQISTSPRQLRSPSSRHSSPEAPPYSPITPPLPHATLSTRPNPATVGPPTFMDSPPTPVPINESTNPDAVALRAALGVLNIQRKRATEDIQILVERKEEALADPKGFGKALREGTVKIREELGIVGGSWRDDNRDGETEIDSDEDEVTEVIGAVKMDHAESEGRGRTGNRFGEIPSAQNVVRCPPINWAKYHVVGEVLDQLHEEQRLRPTLGVPDGDLPMGRAEVSVVAAPYSPWKDRLPETSMRTRSDARKG